MPVNTTAVFPKNTEKVFCWFAWKNAQKNTSILARWRYLTDDILILEYTFVIPRKEGTGSVSLSMPEGKNLPSGKYRVDLNAENLTLKSLSFEVK